MKINPFSLVRRARRFSKFHPARRLTRVEVRRRPLSIECLEERQLLAIDSVSPWHNAVLPTDVNQDGRTTALDAIAIINQLNQYGSYRLASVERMLAAASLPGTSTADGTSAAAASAPNLMYDVNNDGILSALDAMIVINQINQQQVEPIVRVRLEVTDTSGNVITRANVGDAFQLRIYVQDLRTDVGNNGGVFNASFDVTYDAALADVTGAVSVQSPYGMTSGDTSVDGLINELTGIDGVTPLGPSERLFAIVPMIAQARGTLNFATDPADDLGNAWIVYGNNDPVPNDQIDFGTATLQIGPKISIAPASVTEGNSGTTQMTFEVTLDFASTETVTVDFATVMLDPAEPDRALEGVDYQIASGTLTFNPGVVSQTITVNVIGDNIHEGNERFRVVLSNPQNADLDAENAEAIGTILDDDPQPVISIATPDPIIEGDSGTKQLAFVVSLSNPSSLPITVNFSTVPGTATEGVDYVGATGQLTFDPGDNEKTILITINGDTNDEPDETFQVVLSTPSNATIGVGTATGTILDDDGPLELSINDPDPVLEGDAGTTPLVFTVTLSRESSEVVTVAFVTVAGTATEGVDYEAAGGTLTFQPGETSKTITVNVLGDTISEAEETFTVLLFAASDNAVITRSAGLGRITDDDPLPEMSITANEPAGVLEGNSGAQDAVFTVTLSAASEQVVTVQFATLAGTATSGVDFDPVSGTLTFQPGEMQKEIRIPIHGDTLNEADETYQVVLSNVSGATFASGGDAALGIILNDDPLPTVSISSPEPIVEGDTGTTDLVFTVTLSEASGQAVSVEFFTLPITAVMGTTPTTPPGADFVGQIGTLVFQPGEMIKTITIQIVGDTQQEPTETFEVRLNDIGVVNAVLGNAVATGTILDDDQPRISINSVTVNETDGIATLTVTLSQAGNLPVTVDFATVAVTATADVDYVTTSGTLTFAVGELTKTITVSIVNDDLMESTETFNVQLSNATNASIQNGTGVVTILDDDSILPNISISDVTVNEGDGVATLVVSLSQASTHTVTVDFVTFDLTALHGKDYVAQQGTLTFAPGETSKTITIEIINDALNEDTELFGVLLGNAQFGNIVDDAGVVTILDDDPLPVLSLDTPAPFREANSDQTLMLAVRLSAPSGRDVSFKLSLDSITATLRADFLPLDQERFTIAAGNTLIKIPVTIVGDSLAEPTETFLVRINNPRNAVIPGPDAVASAIATIEDNDPRNSISGFVYIDVNNNGIFDDFENRLAGVMIRLTGLDDQGRALPERTVMTDVNGYYQFDNLDAGVYTIHEIQPEGFTNGQNTIGRGARLARAFDDSFEVVVFSGDQLDNFNFGERGPEPGTISKKNFIF
jgi:hypothetical protein